MIPFQRLDEFLVSFRQREIETEIDDGSDDAAHQIRNQKSLAPVFQVVEVCSLRSTFIKVTGLEEEKTHEEEAPSHHFEPPLLLILTTKSHDVQRDHSDDTNATKDVEGVISLFHKLSGKTSSAGR